MVSEKIFKKKKDLRKYSVENIDYGASRVEWGLKNIKVCHVTVYNEKKSGGGDVGKQKKSRKLEI